jgi:hypothetical protein
MKKIKNLGLFIIMITSFNACDKEKSTLNAECDWPIESYVEINGDREFINQFAPNLIFRCEYINGDDWFVIGIDELITNVGGIEINDVLGLVIRIKVLEEGTYPMVRINENFCETKELVIPTNAGISTFQLDNCCSYFNKTASVEIKRCSDNYLVKVESVEYTELECDLNKGISFTASFQFVCS